MKPARFDYHRPTDVNDAVSLLAQLEDDECKPLAGGQSLVPLMNFRLARPVHLVDLNPLTELKGVERRDGELRLGPLTRHAQIEDDPQLADLMPLLPTVAAHIGYRQIRTRGTIGGAVCHADPVAEWPMVARLLDAQLEVRGPAGERTVAAGDFFFTIFTPNLEPTELLTALRVPLLPERSGWGFSELARKVGDYAVVSAGAVVTLDDQGAVGRARLAFSGVATTPVRATEAERALVGLAPDDAAGLEHAARQAAEGLDPPADVHGSSDYRRRVAAALARRTLEQALARAGEES